MLVQFTLQLKFYFNYCT